jgi:hypothetical protein
VEGGQMSVEIHSINRAFSRYLSSNKLSGRLAEIVQALAEEGIQSTRLRDLIPLHEDQEYLVIQSDLLDLALFYITFCLEDHYLTPNESSDLYYLRTAFRIQEEDIYNHKYTQMEQILSGQITKILGDQNVDKAEALQQVELQRCFGLSYDQFLKITRPYVDEIINNLLELISADNVITRDERKVLENQISGLKTVYFLTTEQEKLLSGLAK